MGNSLLSLSATILFLTIIFSFIRLYLILYFLLHFHCPSSFSSSNSLITFLSSTTSLSRSNSSLVSRIYGFFFRSFMNSISSKSKIVSFLSLVKNCNHKRLGIYYLFSAFIFGISGTLISVLMRIELYSSGNRIISPENQNFYNISITLHGFLMIFFLVMPSLFGGFGNYFVPIFLGSPEVVYPRVNNFSILILSLSYLFLILSLIPM